MVFIKKAFAKDFESIYPLFEMFNNPNLNKEDWNKLFIKHCDTDEDYFGFVLMDDNKVVGFLGAIFSDRVIRDKIYKFCNMTAWVVKKEYRSYGILLINQFNKLTEYTITDLTPTYGAYDVFKKFEYKDLDNFIKLFIPFPNFKIFNKDYRIYFDNEIIRSILNDNDIKIFSDHLKFKKNNVVICCKNNYCYLIISITKRKGIRLAHIHYISNKTLFYDSFNIFRLKLCLKFKVFGIIIDERFVETLNIFGSFKVKLKLSGLYKSNELERKDIDILYSELFILNHL
ncbi:MAG: hypothetical protein ABSG15_04970 [FCB group bacterium]|jgi:hypothetical protein